MYKLCKGVPFIAVCSIFLLLQGCIVAGIGAGVGAWKYGDSKQEEAASKCKTAYNSYLENVQKTKQAKVLTLQEYCPS